MIPPSGPVDAKIMVVGEAPGEQEIIQRAPFVGASGQLLNKMLSQAQILRSECFLTNVARERPPGNDIDAWIPKAKKDITPDMVLIRERYVSPQVAAGVELLWKEIQLVSPNVILAFGNVPLWVLTGKWGIKSWRGSLLSTAEGTGFSASSPSRKVIPVYHPAYILRDWSALTISVNDLRRAREESLTAEISSTKNSFVIRPNYDQAQAYLAGLLEVLARGPLTVAADIETRSGHIACLGLATTADEAFCIPFMCTERDSGYWLPEEEYQIVRQLKRVLTHPSARVVGQNFIYDTQYIYRHWGFVPSFFRDTMLGHHACFLGLPKGLDYLSSMYAKRHIYWKDESKDWDPKVGEDQLWAYNCKDCIITYEVDEAIQAGVDKMGLRKQHDFQQAMFWPVLQAMVRGIRRDDKRTAAFAMELTEEVAKREQWLERILGHPINPKSPLQMRKLFYEDLQQKVVINRSTKEVTTNAEALDTIARREPILRPLVRRITELRSLGVFMSTFVGARSGHDGRLRCSFNIAGTETLRLSSSTDAFGSGMNLQNIPEGGKDSEDAELELPNVRTLFIPDPGYTFFNADLERADLQVVVEEADDDDLRCKLHDGADIHAENAKDLGIDRALAKRWVHAANYGAQARTLSVSCGLTIHRSEQMLHRWFSIHPGIQRWHERTSRELAARATVSNVYGYKRIYFDRTDGLLPEALAWIPQSTVSRYINEIWLAIYRQLPDVQVLLQVHDSLAGQIPTHLVEWTLGEIRRIARETVIEYPHPLVIPLEIKTSPVSWGDCK